tara:strand:- start:297 stop:515 length:219 start_codon:yes stop_codon:yes gene_type:complete
MKLVFFLYLLHTCLAEGELPEENSNNGWAVLFVFLGAILFFVVLNCYANKPVQNAGQEEEKEELVHAEQLNF